MIYTTLLEPYRFPKVVPVEVTVLRGARRLRLSSALRRRYADFVPKIWHLMSKLGYQRYLQKLYVSIESEAILTSPFYQLPIVLALLEAVSMLRLPKPIHAIGRFLADYTLVFPSAQNDGPANIELGTILPEDGIRLEQYLNCLHTDLTQFRNLSPNLRDLFPGVRFSDTHAIDLTATPLDILKKIPAADLEARPLYISLKNKPLAEGKLELLTRLHLNHPIALRKHRCFCNQVPCRCTKTEILQYQEQLRFLTQLYSLKVKSSAI